MLLSHPPLPLRSPFESDRLVLLVLPQLLTRLRGDPPAVRGRVLDVSVTSPPLRRVNGDSATPLDV